MNTAFGERVRWTGVVLLVDLIEPQLLMFTGVGAMKSLSAAVNESDDRLFRYALPNATHFVARDDASKSTDASPNVRAEMSPSPSLRPIGRDGRSC